MTLTDHDLAATNQCTPQAAIYLRVSTREQAERGGEQEAYPSPLSERHASAKPNSSTPPSLPSSLMPVTLPARLPDPTCSGCSAI